MVITIIIAIASRWAELADFCRYKTDILLVGRSEEARLFPSVSFFFNQHTHATTMDYPYTYVRTITAAHSILKVVKIEEWYIYF